MANVSTMTHARDREIDEFAIVRSAYEQYKQILRVLGRSSPSGLEAAEKVKKRLSSKDFLLLMKTLRA